jgi:hypothetical protein
MAVMALAAFVFGLTLVASTAALLVVLRRRNRVVPRVRTRAPLMWLWSLSAPARAHRRLRRAIAATRAAVGQGAEAGLAVDGLADCVDELQRLAVEADGRLVVAARFNPAVRRAMLRGLRPEIDEIELLGARVAATVVSRAGAREERLADVVARVTERLDALDAAHLELSRLEASWQRPAPSPTAPPTAIPPTRR